MTNYDYYKPTLYFPIENERLSSYMGEKTNRKNYVCQLDDLFKVTETIQKIKKE